MVSNNGLLTHKDLLDWNGYSYKYMLYKSTSGNSHGQNVIILNKLQVFILVSPTHAYRGLFTMKTPSNHWFRM